MPLDLKKPAPLYLQIAEDISARILKGEFRLGDQLGSQQAISLEYSVSLITVKKALSHLAQQGWIYSRVGKGSFVARSAPGTPSLTQRSIGIVLENLQSPFFSRIVQSVEESAYQNGYNVLLSNSSGETEKEERQIRHFRSIGVSGLVIASLHHLYHATPTIQSLHREKFPFVMVSYMDDQDIPFVGTDHEFGAYLATRHLLNLGYQRIGYLNAERGNLVGELRKNGYTRALREFGRQVDSRFLYRIRVHGVRDFSRGGYDIGKAFCRKRSNRPDALFVFNDLTACGFEKALIEEGVRVPEDVALVGFDNIAQAEYAPVPLTTVDQPTAQIGRDAVDILLKMIAGERADLRKIHEPHLVVRESCGAGEHGVRGRATQVQAAAEVTL
jgi:GntR family transcriptional regulator, arabinose operon transcriptional repressor